MPDFSLIPVDYQPDFSDVSLVPVDHDPFSADDLIQQARAQLASQPQRLATSDAPIPGDVNAAMPEAYQNPNLASASGVRAPSQTYNPSAASISAPGKPVLANQQRPGDMPGPGPASGVSGLIGAKIAELGSDFYNRTILKPAKDLRDIGHDLVTDPAYFLHAIGPSLVGLGMSVPTARVGSVGLAERAKEIHNVLDAIAQRMRTTAVLETDAGRIIAGGTQDLNPLQKAALGRGEIAAKGRDVHAEVTALNKAMSIGAKPSELAVTRTICPECAAVIESLGGRLTSRTTAVFPRR